MSALGRGGMGSVDRVYDERRREEVALKRSRTGAGVSSSALDTLRREWTRFKREFRVLSELRHPSLVRVYDLGEDELGLFFTMEIVEGVNIRRFCREGGELAAERLATVLPSLLEGLAHLHARGIVHRDLKPSNVLVDSAGCARIVDFGILAELSIDPGEIIGTAAYMPPEQIDGGRPTPAMDLYALGATLHELVTGAPPFPGTTRAELFAQHKSSPAPAIAPSKTVPPALCGAIQALLSKTPDTRPSIAAFAATALPALGARAPNLVSGSLEASVLFGRHAEQDRIEQHLTGEHFGVVVLGGATGIGKTALAEWCAERARSRGYAVLSGRARRNELVAFNAIDSVVDELAELLRVAPDDELEVHRRRASLAFPVLGRSKEALYGASARAAAFDGLARVLAHTARAHDRLVVTIDDLQWADADSLAFLRALEALAPPRVKIVATLRTDVPESLATRWLNESAAARFLSVEPLDAPSLARIVARATGGTIAENEAVRLAASCAGRPFFAEIAGRIAREVEGAPDLAELLSRRMTGLDEPDRKLLAIVAAADEWLDSALVAEAAEITPGRVEDLASDLESSAIVRRARNAGDDGLDMYHDVAREAARAAVGGSMIRRAHEAIAAVLDRRPDADPLRIVRHLRGADRGAQAAHRAADGARKASDRGAYGLAAELYELAIEGLPDRRAELARARATALIRAGLYDRAIDELRRVEADAGSESIEFDRAYALLMSGSMDAGRAGLDRMLRRERMRPIATRGFALLRDGLRFFAGPRPVPATRNSAELGDRERRERECEIALLLSWEEPGASVSWALRVREHADRSRQPARGASAEYVLAFLAAAGGGKQIEQPLALRYLEAARKRAVAVAEDPHIRALDRAVLAFLELRTGNGVAASREFAAIATDLEHQGLARTHMHLLALSNACGSMMVAERQDDIVKALARFEAACPPDRGAMEAHARVVRIAIAIYAGDRARFEDMRRAARETMPAPDGFKFHHLLHDMWAGYGDIFWGDPTALRIEYARLMRLGRRFKPFDTYVAGALAGVLAIAEAAAVRAGDREASARKIDRWADLARRAPLRSTAAIRAQAYVADHRGDVRRAIALLEEAETIADRAGIAISRAIARHQRAIRIGGDEGDALARSARAALVEIGAGEHLLFEDPGRRDGS